FLCLSRLLFALHSFPTRRSSDLSSVSASAVSSGVVSGAGGPESSVSVVSGWLGSSEEHAVRPSPAAMMSAEVRSNTAEVDSVSRSEEHTSELQSRFDLVCRLLLE